MELKAQELDMIFEDYLRAGLREKSSESNRANVRLTPGSNDILLEGFRADIVAETVPMDFVWMVRSSPEHARNVLAWEQRCKYLACDALGVLARRGAN